MQVKKVEYATDGIVTLDNPLGLVFDTPKSERNLRSTTLFGEPGSHGNDKKEDREERAVPAEFAHAFSISQILG